MSRDGNKGDDSVGGLLMQVAGGALRLLRGEIELRKAEAGLAFAFVIRGAVVIILAVILALLGLGQLADAGHAALVLTGLGPLAASLVMGAILCLLALGLIWWGQRLIRRAPFLARENRYVLRREVAARAAEEKERAND